MTDASTVSKRLVGRRIVRVRYMSKQEAQLAAFDKRPIVLDLDDGTILYPMVDEDSSDGGALATSLEGLRAVAAV